MHTKYPKPGEVIFQQGVMPTHAFLLRTGKCVSERRPGTGEKESMRVEEEALEQDGEQAEAVDITTHAPGEMLGLRELVFKAPYTMTMRCGCTTQLRASGRAIYVLQPYSLRLQERGRTSFYSLAEQSPLNAPQPPRVLC